MNNALPLACALFLCACSDGLEPLNADVTFESVLELEPEGDIFFGEIPIDERTTQYITLHAVGDTPISIQRVSFSDATADVFSVEALNLPIGIQPDSSIDIELSFAPDAVGSFNGHVRVYDGGRELSRRVLGFACDPLPGSTNCN